MTPGVETPVAGSKKITIHVGGSRGSTGASPAPQTAQSSDSGRPDSSMDNNRSILPAAASVTGATTQPDKTRGPAAIGASPSPSGVGAIPGMVAQQSPAVLPRPNGNVPNAVNAPNGSPAPGQHLQQVPAAPNQLQNGHQPAAPAPVPPPLYDGKYRAPGRGEFPLVYKCLQYGNANAGGRNL